VSSKEGQEPQSVFEKWS